MYPSQFEHVPVDSVDDAVAALQEYEDAELLAGGQSLVPLQKTRFASPDYLVDITGIEELQYVDDAGDAVEVGALASHTQIQRAQPVKDHVYLFSECIGQIADWPVRNQGTFGGTVAEADPSGDYLPVLQILDPEITLVGPDGERTVPFEEFYLGMFTVDMEEGELITRARLPKLTPSSDAAGIGSTYKKHAERSGDYALASVAAIVEVDDAGDVTDARLSVGGVGPLTRPEEAESLVEGTDLDDDVLAEAAAAVREAVLPDEEGPEGDYKEAMAGEFTERALETAYERATESI
ncbi:MULTISPECIES: FAD binding domain-containing protein [Halorussus]|uniref:FAD binding domain-containing protein n=1 Tax=Halorussus TaxID=1070314 RepID=UPI00209E3FA0|nr:xanthine dehydrogenase family protein subunit M [Halorussus vallis]USZ77880.1 xanthine dehydrogenase family protein subunit M [Halorussus vallis]